MSEIAISLNKISKCFKRYPRPVERLKELLLPGKSRAEEFWALHEINLQVPKGQTLGIVGRNGSGKSTLLQIIASTLTPSTGEAIINGRLSALLELGSGFNPEFTGRQNVFFNGQLLGLTRKEIESKFDEIADFADIGDFIEQPVKTYSSGMFVRLAFAVATSVEPDILVVDEALSVGDEAFQRKCFARIENIRSQGGTVLFVSHAASTIIELCDRAILMDRGEILLQATPKLVVSKYQELIYAPPDKADAIRAELRNGAVQDSSKNGSVLASKSPETLNKNSRNQSIELPHINEFYDPSLSPENTISYISRGAKIITPCIKTVHGKLVNNLINKRDYIYTYSVIFQKAATNVRFGMLIKTISGFELGGASFSPSFHKTESFEADQEVQIQFKFKCLLHPGVYFLNAGVSGVVDGEFTYLARCIDAAIFRVKPDQQNCGNGIIDFQVEPSLEKTETWLQTEGEIKFI